MGGPQGADVMTAAERARMRETLRTALGTSLLPGATLEHPGGFVPAAVADDRDPAARFRAELEALGGSVHEATDAEDARAIVTGLIRAQSIASVFMWAPEQLPVPAMDASLRAAGIDVRQLAPGDLDSTSLRDELAEVAVGLTGSTAGLVETGSIVVVSGPGRPRLASLLPPVHIALLRRTDLVPSLAHLLTTRPGLADQGANLVCITGPSRTADIEHTLSRGVHGPKEVHVVLLG
jgi:L-lactate dehydrogenase complex protein LldG